MALPTVHSAANKQRAMTARLSVAKRSSATLAHFANKKNNATTIENQEGKVEGPSVSDVEDSTSIPIDDNVDDDDSKREIKNTTDSG